MRILGLNITREKDARPVPTQDLRGLNGGGWYPIVREPFTGAWQKNQSLPRTNIVSYHAVYACATLIAADISKLGANLVELTNDGVWLETKNPAYSPVLRKPNRYQTFNQFIEVWVLSKLLHGNTYVLKVRDNRNVVVDLFVLDPRRVKPLVSDDGGVYYDLSSDNLSGLETNTIVPASEIIHDRWNCIFHPLVGTSPIFAAAFAASQGLAIQDNSTLFFNNMSQPGGMLTAPGKIGNDTAIRLKKDWEENFGGKNLGRLAVAGDGLKYESFSVPAREAQLIEQLKWTAEVVASVFHVPGYKIGVGEIPVNASVQSLNLEYYSQALQKPIEDIEVTLDDGLSLADDLGIMFNIDNLLRMDTLTQMQALGEGVKSGLMAPNEGRKKINLPKAKGGDTPYLQQQNFSLAALAKRDASDNPFGVAPVADRVVVPPDNASSERTPPPPNKEYKHGSLAKALEYELAA